MIFANDSQNLRRHATAEFVDFPGGDFRADFRRRQIHRRNRQRHDARDAAQRGGNGRQRGRVAAHDGEFHLAAKPFRVAPPVELRQLIRAENPKKIRARERVFEMLDRADRPARPALFELPGRNFRARERRERRAQHRQPQRARSARRARLQRRLRRGNKNQPVELQLEKSGLGERQMRPVRRVEAPAENPDAHPPKQRLARRGDGIVPAAGKRVAPQHAPRGQQRSRKKSVFQQRLPRVLRARRRKPAETVPAGKKPQRRRNDFPVKRDERERGENARPPQRFRNALHHAAPRFPAFPRKRATMRRAASR